jgi:hypothetical protein
VFHMHNPMFAIALMLCMGTASPIVTLAQTAALPLADRTTFDAQQRQWLACVGPLLDASEDRFRAFLAADKRLCGLAVNCVTVEGGQAFQDAALGFDASFMSNDNLQKWVRSQYVKHLFAVDELKTAELREAEQLETDLTEIDDQVLVELGCDVDLAGHLAQYPKTPADFSALELGVARAAGALVHEVKQAQVEQFAVVAGGVAVGHYAGEAAADAMRDENGELSGGAWLGSLLVEMAVDATAANVGQHVADTKGRLRRTAIKSAQDLVHGYIAAAPAEQRTQHLMGCVRRHNSAVVHAVIQELGVDGKWALEVYNHAIDLRRTAKK